MKRVAFWLPWVLCVHAAFAAGHIVIASPDRAQTFSYSHMIDHRLHWNARAQSLTASITFSNLHYVSDKERRVDETFDFAFPGVRFDSQTRTYHAPSPSQEQVPVAAVRREPFGDSIKPLPGTCIYVFKKSGRVRAVLVAGPDFPLGLHWLERKQGFFLQNLFCRFENRPAGQDRR